MPRNVYFSHGSNAEQILFEDIQIEALKIYGHETYYLPRKILTRDMILNEDRESLFDDAYMIEMYIEDIEGFGGEGNLMSKFGLEIRDEVTFVVARRSWNKLVGIWNNTVDNFRPNEGDLIYLPLSNSLFEISFVEHEQPFYQIQNLPVYKLQARLFEYNDEDFRTGIEGIDDIETVHADILSMLIRNITGDIELGTRLYQYFPSVEYNTLVARKDALPGLIAAETEQSEKDILQAELDGIDSDILDAFNAMPYISGIITEQDALGGTITNRTVFLADFETNTTDPKDFYVSTNGNLDTYITNALTLDEFNSPTVRAEIYEIYDLNDNIDRTFENDDAAQNFEFEKEADDIIDFSEQNPFGEPS
jgi:hypothetical protein